MSYQPINTNEIKLQLSNIFNNMGLQHYLTENKFNSRDILIYQFPSFNTIVNTDGITPTLRLLNSHDGSMAFRIMVGCIRWVCTNGLAAGDMLYSQRIIHTAGPTLDQKLNDLPNQVAAALHYLQYEFADDIADLVNINLSENQSINIIGNLNVPKKVKDTSIFRLYKPRRQEDYTQQHTVWGLLNNVNESLRERSPITVSRFEQNDRLLADIVELAKVA